MAQNYVQPGEVIPVILAGTVLPGVPYVIGGLFGISLGGGVSGDTIDVALTGVFKIVKKTSQAWTQGVQLYWDSTALNFTTTVGSNTVAGFAFLPADSADAVGYIRLKQG